jgi:hypothetical protein
MEDVIDAAISQDRPAEVAQGPAVGLLLIALGLAANLAWIGFLLWLVLGLVLRLF